MATPPDEFRPRAPAVVSRKALQRFAALSTKARDGLCITSQTLSPNAVGLMNGFGPSADGEFHPEALRQMKGAGAWLKVNGEAIYATRPREGDGWSEDGTVRYTRYKDRRFAYAILTAWPGTQAVLKSVLSKPGSRVTLLGSQAALTWQFDAAKGTTIAFRTICSKHRLRPCLEFEAGSGVSLVHGPMEVTNGRLSN
jgi:hypothetical protein